MSASPARPPAAQAAPSFERKGAFVAEFSSRESSRDAERLRESLADWSAAMAAVSDLPAIVRQDIADALVLARRFVSEVVRPQAPQWDRLATRQPASVAIEVIERAQSWGLFSLWMPALFGGQGWNFLSLYAFLEEVAGSCASVAQAIGAHYMGLSLLSASWNLRLSERVLHDVCRAGAQGPVGLISLAMLEPGVGNHLAAIAQAPQGWLQTRAVRQGDGSYVVSGTKIGVAYAGSARWYMVLACEDTQRTAPTLVLLAVAATSPGCRIQALDSKLGQRASVEGTLVFDEVHVPAECVGLDAHLSAHWGRSHADIMQGLLDAVLACTRTGVAAVAAGVARGAWEAARDHVSRQLVHDERLVDQSWVRTELAELAAAAASARQNYLEAAVALGMGGLFQMMFFRPLYWADQLMPMWLWRWMSRRVMLAERATRWFQNRFLIQDTREWRRLTGGLGARAKVVACDLALCNVNQAMDLMGVEALRASAGMDKRLRDVLTLRGEQGGHTGVRRLAFEALHAAGGAGT